MSRKLSKNIKKCFKVKVLIATVSLFGTMGRRVVGFLKFHLIVMFLIVLSPNYVIAKNFDFSHWDILLKKYVDASLINDTRLNTFNYKKLQSNSLFKQLLDELNLFSPSKLQTREEKIAFWINVYNVFTVKIVIENYPIQSIKDIGNFFKPVWQYKAGIVGGREYTLHQIEHEILRKMGEPRIHVAIVCASVSCPDLATNAYKSEGLNEQLDAQMRVFLANSKKGMRFDSDSKRIFLSKIFKWFREDFEEHGGVLEYILPYVSQENRQILKKSSPRIFYLDYDWRLNDNLL